MPKRSGNKKHSMENIQGALDMIRRGENPFRASKMAGIARTTLLYHLQKLPNDAFPSGVNPIVQHIQHQIEIVYWKAMLRAIKAIYHLARKSNEKVSPLLWETLSRNEPRSTNFKKAIRPLLDNPSVDDTVIFRECIIGPKANGKKSSENNLSEAGLDSGEPGGDGAESVAGSPPKEG
jgi:hypothetical protein